MERIVRKFDSSEQVVHQLAECLLQLSQRESASHVALSGGSTPKALFQYIVSQDYLTKIDWKKLHIWWGDERLVSPESDDSNFGQANQLLLRQTDIPAENIHRIKGELSPEQALLEFDRELSTLASQNGQIVFDWIMLGVGDDGHTASLFPGQTDYESSAHAVLAKQPQSGQLRVSLSARVIANAKRVSYLVLGEPKAKVVKEILEERGDWESYPAARIRSELGLTDWFLDAGSASLL